MDKLTSQRKAPLLAGLGDHKLIETLQVGYADPQ